VAAHLRAGLDALGTIGGSVTPDDVIGLVFARFCVGK
jgi:tRNA U34 5-carboxymethylaminomethyl modifying GTPase MnmE/TrmE